MTVHRMDGVSRQQPSQVDREQMLGAITGHAVFMVTPEARIESWPATAEDIYGYESEQVTGQHVQFLHADDTVAVIEEVLTNAKSETVVHESWHERPNGSVFWATWTISPVYNDSFHGYAVVAQDTTRQKQYIRMLERQNDRLKEFTDILSHDLQNPLKIITTQLDFYRHTGDDEHLDTIEQTTGRMKRLIDDLLRIAENGDVVTDPEPTDIAGVIEAATTGTLTTEVTLEYESVPHVMGDSDRLHQLFENLFANAVDHGGADVTIRVGPMDGGFYVADTGPGIPEAQRATVFDHGFTTTDDGSGFGLSLVQTIVGAHGWDIAVTESDTGGARFEITGIEFVDSPHEQCTTDTE